MLVIRAGKYLLISFNSKSDTCSTFIRESASADQRISAFHLRRGWSSCGISVARIGEVDAGRSPLFRRSKGQIRGSDGTRFSIGYGRLELSESASLDSRRSTTLHRF